jgi:hypothetical protein
MAGKTTVSTKSSTNTKKSSSTKTYTKSKAKDTEGKKGKSAYNVFMGEQMKILKEEDEIEGKERLKEVGRRWNELSSKEREKYEDIAAEENKREGREVGKRSKSRSRTVTKTKPGDTKKGKSTMDKKDDKKKKDESTKDDDEDDE